MSTAIASGGGARRPLRIGRVLVVAAALAATTVPVARFLTAGRDAGDQSAPPRIESDQERLTSLQQRVASSPDDAGAWLSLAELATQQAVRTGDPASYDVAQRAVGEARRLTGDDPRALGVDGVLALSLHDFARAYDIGVAAHGPTRPAATRSACSSTPASSSAATTRRPVTCRRCSTSGPAPPPWPGPPTFASSTATSRAPWPPCNRRPAPPPATRRHGLLHRAPRSPLPGAGRPRPCRRRLRRRPRAVPGACRSDARCRPRRGRTGRPPRRHRPSPPTPPPEPRCPRRPRCSASSTCRPATPGRPTTPSPSCGPTSSSSPPPASTPTSRAPSSKPTMATRRAPSSWPRPRTRRATPSSPPTPSAGPSPAPAGRPRPCPSPRSRCGWARRRPRSACMPRRPSPQPVSPWKPPPSCAPPSSCPPGPPCTCDRRPMTLRPPSGWPSPSPGPQD